MTLRHPVAYLVCVLGVAGVLFAHSGRRDASFVLPPAAAALAPGTVPDVAGIWAGSWVDTVYTVAGSLSITIIPKGNIWIASGTIDVGALNPVLGMLGGNALGNLTGNTLAGTFTCNQLGNGSFTITGATGVEGTPLATASGTGSVVAPLNFGGFTFTGNIFDGVMEGGFDFTSPTGGAGRGSLVRITPVQPTTWSDVKTLYGS